MLISHAKRFIFIHNPKAAGTTFRTAINPLHDDRVVYWGFVENPFFQMRMDTAHLRSWEMPIVAPDIFSLMDDYRTLAFVRDPLERFLSACAEFFRSARPQSRFQHWPARGKRMLIQRLIRSGVIQSGVLANYRYVHFSPQVWFTHLGQRRIVRQIVHIRPGNDDLAEGFAYLGLPYVKVPPVNVTRNVDWSAVASQEIKDFVRIFYAQDYAMLAKLEPGQARLGQG